MSAPLLEAIGLGRDFGHFTAIDDVSATFEANKVTSIIGPNGAGKSTFFNILSGALAPTRGSVRFKGRSLAGVPHHRYAHIGIARSYQITNVFPELSVHENVRVAAQAFRSRYNIWTPRVSLHELDDKAETALANVGLSHHRRGAAKHLAHGEQRALEIAIALVGDPVLLLLDEPTAGMGPEETKATVSLIERLATERTILLVEHKMKMILGLSDRILVLHHGRLIADGTPQDIQSNAEVRRVYLGQSQGYA